MNPEEIHRLLGKIDNRLDGIDSKIRQAEDELEGLRKTIEDHKITIEDYKIKLKYFFAGFSALTILGLGTGVLFKEQIRYPLIELVYPTKRVLEQVTIALANDDTQRRKLRDSLIPQTDYGEVRIESFPKIKNELPPKVWESIQSGNEEQFERFVAKPEFINNLIKRYEGDLARIFSSLYQSTDYYEFDSRLTNAGRTKYQAQVKLLAERFQNESTTCGYKIDHDKLQATIALPESLRPFDYWWFGCYPHYPKISLLLELDETMKLDGIQLVGVEKSKNNNIEVRLTRAAANQLQTHGEEGFSGLTTGSVSIEKVWR